MRTLLIDTSDAGASQVAGSLDAAGHDVVRCHPHEGVTFPCSGLTEDGCPLEGHGPVDVAITVRDGAGEPTSAEAGVTCAIRTGIPVVVVGAAEGHPYEQWAESISTAPVSEFREMAPAGHTSMHQASAQCIQVRGTHARSIG